MTATERDVESFRERGDGTATLSFRRERPKRLSFVNPKRPPLPRITRPALAGSLSTLPPRRAQAEEQARWTVPSWRRPERPGDRDPLEHLGWNASQRARLECDLHAQGRLLQSACRDRPDGPRQGHVSWLATSGLSPTPGTRTEPSWWACWQVVPLKRRTRPVCEQPVARICDSPFRERSGSDSRAQATPLYTVAHRTARSADSGVNCEVDLVEMTSADVDYCRARHLPERP